MPEAFPVPTLPGREHAGHKGTFGTVMVLGGQVAPPRMMIGGPALSAMAALRAGAGLAVLAMPRPILAAGLTVAPSATGLALPVDERGRLRPSEVAEIVDGALGGVRCLAAGPGLGADEPQQRIVMRLVGRDDVPLVLDADALNALAAMRDFHRDFRAQAICTPHPGEFARLAGALRIEADPRDPAGRAAAAEALARRLGCIVVLKGAGTVVTDGQTTTINPSGGAALATAGTGDVLSGIIAGLVAQHVRPAGGALSLLECARAAVYAHGVAADRWTAAHGDGGLLAADLLDELPGVLSAMRVATGR
jgi:NAD(P)H-hydrate epimerase